MEETIDIRECFNIIKKRFWIVILTTGISLGIVTIMINRNKVQFYEAKTTMIVNVARYSNQPMLTADQIYTGEVLALFYGEIIKSRSVLQPVIEKLNLDMTPQQLSGMISVSQVEDTHIMNLSVTDTDPDRARYIANTIPVVFTEEVKRTINANGVEVLDSALEVYPIVSNNSKKVAIAGAIGVIIGLLIIYLIEFLDNKIKTPQDIERRFNIQVLGVIPNEIKQIQEKKMKDLITINNPKSPISEAYRGIRTSIQFSSNPDKKIKVINITSSKRGEGKTTVLANLATTFANLEKKVLIMDGNLRNPRAHRLFRLTNIYGLTDVLLENKTFEECVYCTDVKNLHVLTCGTTHSNPSEILASNKMMEFVSNLRDKYDYIFIDTPPVGLVTDAEIVSTYSDGCVFVVGAKEANIETIKLSIDKLEKIDANILGSILNKFEVSKGSSDYYSHYYKKGRKFKNKSKNNKEKRNKRLV